MMSAVAAFLIHHPFAGGVAFFLLVSLLVAALLAWMMRRAGTSLRPLVFVFGYVAIIGGPQGMVHLLNGYLSARMAAAPGDAPAVAKLPANTSLQPVSWAIVFGPNADPALITDARQSLGAVLANAADARLSFRADGGSALAARFASADAAAAALNAYGRFFQFAEVTGNDAAGWTARRHGGQGEWNHVVVAGNELYAWTGPTRDSVIAERVRALGPLADAIVDAAPASPGRGPAIDWLQQRPSLLATFAIINLVLAVGWFFKVSAWATRVRPPAGTRAVDASSLRQRLLALNDGAGPLTVTRQDDGDIRIDWRYGDAQWFDLMRVQAMRRAHRLVLRLDHEGRIARVREYWRAFDASAGAGGANLRWQASMGMQFFHVEHERVFGVQLDEQGRPTGELSKAFTFDLQALKRPVIEAVTAAGWTWQPVMLYAPPGLRWLMA